MTAPVIRQFVGSIPDKGQAQITFDTNVDSWLDWTTLQFAPDLVAFGTWADGVRAALIAGNLPSLAGRALDAVRVNAAADGVEFADVTSAGWALLDDANAAAQRVTLGAAALSGPTFTGVPAGPTPAAATNTTQLATTAYTRTAIPDVLNASGAAPVYACRAWVNFNGTGTVAIRASGNVSSITDNGTGDYTINFATALPDANYAATCNGVDTDGGGVSRTPVVSNKTTTTCRVRTSIVSSGAAVDNAICDVAIFR